MSPTMRRLSGRSTSSSTSFPSSRIAIRVSRGAALMRISLFIVARLTLARRLGERSRGRFKKVRAVVLQGRVMIFRVFHHQRPSIHVFGARESRERPMHEEQQSVTTIYGDT